MRYAVLLIALLALGACKHRYDPAMVGLGLGLMQPPPGNVICQQIGHTVQCY